jgi:PPOX class probable F420-dependent enzyme
VFGQAHGPELRRNKMAQALREKLVGYIQDAHAMEERVLQMLTSLIANTRDPQTRADLEQHKRETKSRVERLRERQEEIGESTTELQDVQRQARLYTLIDEVYRDRDAANKDEIVRKLEELGLADSVRDLLPLPDGPIPRPALAIAVDRVIAGVTGPAVWEGQSNPADVANPREPEGGVTYGTSEVGTAGVVEETGTKELPVKLRGYPSVEDTGPVPRVEAPVPLVELNDADLDLLRGKHFALIATLLPDGSPHTDVVWVDIENGVVEVNTSAESALLENIRRDPRVAISIYDQDDPRPMISISLQGRVIETTDQGADEHLDRLARKYTGQDRYAEAGSAAGETRWIVRIRPERISRYGY